MLLSAAFCHYHFVYPNFKHRGFAKGFLIYIVNVCLFALLYPYFVIGLEFTLCGLISCEPIEHFVVWKVNFGCLFLFTFIISAVQAASDGIKRQTQNKDTELKFLQSQLNPHFLFNTLNNLYGLAVEKSNILPPLMLQLSDLLEYSLYDTQEDYVPLEKELIYLQNYVALEKIRLETRTKIRLEINGDFTKNNIAPMLLIVFLENTFKHLGTSKGRKEEVNISLGMHNNELDFLCQNSIFLKNEVELEHLEHKGIGLENVRKRLELIYSGRHQLNIHKDSRNFTVHLKINL